MAFDFPSSPTLGQQFTPVTGVTYTYNGVGWTLAQTAIVTLGSLVQITRVDVAAAVPQVDFTTGLDGTYDEYEVHLLNVKIDTTGGIVLRISQDAGATWKAGSADYGYAYIYAATTPAGFVSTGAQIWLTHTDMVGGGNNPLVGRLFFAFPSVAGASKLFNSAATYSMSGGFFRSVTAGGSYVIDTNPINGIRFLPSNGGNFTGGSFVLYGIKK